MLVLNDKNVDFKIIIKLTLSRLNLVEHKIKLEDFVYIQKIIDSLVFIKNVATKENQIFLRNSLLC